MSFFGLTQLGYQDPIREHVRDPGFSPQHLYRSGQYRDPEVPKLPPIKTDLPRPSIVPTDQLSSYGPGAQGSHVEFSRQRAKHIRCHKEPIELFKHPLLTSHEVTAWRKDEPLPQRESWSHVPRMIHRNSEMTRFVNEMSLTNREFSLF